MSDSSLDMHIDGEKLEQNNLTLKQAGTHLRKEKDGFQLRHDEQLSRLRLFEQARIISGATD